MYSFLLVGAAMLVSTAFSIPMMAPAIPAQSIPLFGNSDPSDSLTRPVVLASSPLSGPSRASNSNSPSRPLSSISPSSEQSNTNQISQPIPTFQDQSPSNPSSPKIVPPGLSLSKGQGPFGLSSPDSLHIIWQNILDKASSAFREDGNVIWRIAGHFPNTEDPDRSTMSLHIDFGNMVETSLDEGSSWSMRSEDEESVGGDQEEMTATPPQADLPESAVNTNDGRDSSEGTMTTSQGEDPESTTSDNDSDSKEETAVITPPILRSSVSLRGVLKANARKNPTKKFDEFQILRVQNDDKDTTKLPTGVYCFLVGQGSLQSIWRIFDPGFGKGNLDLGRRYRPVQVFPAPTPRKGKGKERILPTIAEEEGML